MNTLQNTLATQAAQSVLSDNLNIYRAEYATKEEFVGGADGICNQFPDDPCTLTIDEMQAIAGKVWDAANPIVYVYTAFRSNGFDLETIKAKGQAVAMTVGDWDQLIQQNDDEDRIYIAIDADGEEVEY